MHTQVDRYDEITTFFFVGHTCHHRISPLTVLLYSIYERWSSCAFVKRTTTRARIVNERERVTVIVWNDEIVPTGYVIEYHSSRTEVHKKKIRVCVFGEIFSFSF